MNDTEKTIDAPVEDVAQEEAKPVRRYGFTKDNAAANGRKGGAAGSRKGIPPGSTGRLQAIKMLNADKECLHPAELNEELQKELGISTNPLREMERMLRTGSLAARDQISILKTMTEYTHQKRPSVQKVDATLRAEDFLNALADELNGDTE